MHLLIDVEILETGSASDVVESVLASHAEARVCLTCSFQAEDIIVLDLLRQRLPKIAVLFLETGYHFPETYEFRDKLAKE
jgi:phosphoadenosine phosphosulfate reductase